MKYHRLKPGGVPTFFSIFVAVKLKYHRLKPGGVSNDKLKHIGHGEALNAESMLSEIRVALFQWKNEMPL